MREKSIAAGSVVLPDWGTVIQVLSRDEAGHAAWVDSKAAQPVATAASICA